MTGNDVLKAMNIVTDDNSFRAIVNRMADLYEKKNNDYGNAFDESLDEEGIVAARVRIGDKFRRFKALTSNKKQLIKDESIDDTLLDMACYCVMTYMWRHKD